MRKPAVRNLEGTSLEDATAAMLRQGFIEHDRGEDHVVFKRAGRGSFATKAENVDLEAALTRRGGDTDLQVSYDTTVLLERQQTASRESSRPSRDGTYHPLASLALASSRQGLLQRYYGSSGRLAPSRGVRCWADRTRGRRSATRPRTPLR